MVLNSADKIIRTNNKNKDGYSLDTKAVIQLLVPLARFQLSVGMVLYIAEAEPGTSLTSTNWRVQRITNTSTTNRTEWAGGVGTFIHAANDVTSLSYS